jgi:hypothetical protein
MSCKDGLHQSTLGEMTIVRFQEQSYMHNAPHDIHPLPSSTSTFATAAKELVSLHQHSVGEGSAQQVGF